MMVPWYNMFRPAAVYAAGYAGSLVLYVNTAMSEQTSAQRVNVNFD